MAAQLLVSCGAVPIKDETFYVDAGPDGAVIVHFLTSQSGMVDKAAWDQMREGMFCMSSNAMGDFKAELEKVCSVEGHCEWQTQAADFFDRSFRARKYVFDLKADR